MRRFAVEEEYGPPASPLAWPKSGELKLPMGVARLTLLKMFRAETLNVKLYRLLLAAPSIPPPPRPPKPPRPPPGPPGPPGPRPNVPPAPGPPAPVFTGSFFWPKPNVLLRRRLSEKRPALVKELMGTMVSPGCGIKSKDPYLVGTTETDWGDANAGRSL